MLLAIDIGNTSTSFGLFRGKKLIRHWRCETKKIALKKTKNIDAIIISSVVPKTDRKVQKIVQKLFKTRPVFVTYKNAGIKIGYPRPKEIGADRLVNAVAAWQRYHAACIAIDFGTATTLDYIDDKGTYWGGPIAPGLGIANRILYEAAAKVPLTKLVVGNKMLPRSTKEAIQSGVYQGYIGLVEHLIRKTFKEIGRKPKIIATGGLANLIAKGTDIFDAVDPLLTLKGLQLLAQALK